MEQSKCLNDRLTTSLNEERLQSVAATEQTSGSQRSSLPLAFFHHQPLRPELIPTRLTRVYSFTVVSANFTALPLVFHCLLPPPRHQPSASQAASSKILHVPKGLAAGPPCSSGCSCHRLPQLPQLPSGIRISARRNALAEHLAPARMPDMASESRDRIQRIPVNDPLPEDFGRTAGTSVYIVFRRWLVS